MKIKTPYILSFMFLLAGVCYAEDPVAPQLPTTMNKEAWIKQVNQNLPQALCQTESYFVRCFDTTPTACQEFSKLLVEACLNNIRVALPEEINKELGESWGQKVGRCTHGLYDKFMSKKKKTLSECNTAVTPVAPVTPEQKK